MTLPCLFVGYFFPFRFSFRFENISAKNAVRIFLVWLGLAWELEAMHTVRSDLRRYYAVSCEVYVRRALENGGCALSTYSTWNRKRMLLMAYTSHGRCNCAPNRDHPSRYSSQLFPLPSSLWFTKRHSQTFKIINLIFISFFALCLSFASLTLRPFRITVMRQTSHRDGSNRIDVYKLRHRSNGTFTTFFCRSQIDVIDKWLERFPRNEPSKTIGTTTRQPLLF